MYPAWGGEMKHSIKKLRCLFILVLFFALVSPIPGATIKKKNGEIITGVIRGLIGLGYVTEPIKKGNKVTYGGAYFLIHGEDIQSITEEGVLFNPEKGMNRVLVMAETQPTAVEALEAATGSINYVRIGGTKGWGGNMIEGVTEPNPIPAPILGELRVEESNALLIPAIEVVTEKETIVIPIEEIVEIKKKVQNQF
jgi:hypothetical protein